jgi:hypothetical protein
MFALSRALFIGCMLFVASSWAMESAIILPNNTPVSQYKDENCETYTISTDQMKIYAIFFFQGPCKGTIQCSRFGKAMEEQWARTKSVESISPNYFTILKKRFLEQQNSLSQKSLHNQDNTEHSKS